MRDPDARSPLRHDEHGARSPLRRAVSDCDVLSLARAERSSLYNNGMHGLCEDIKAPLGVCRCSAVPSIGAVCGYFAGAHGMIDDHV